MARVAIFPVIKPWMQVVDGGRCVWGGWCCDACRPTAAALSGHEMLKQIHRKHNPPPLTELLRPLNPISASGISLPGHSVRLVIGSEFAFCSAHVDAKNGPLLSAVSWKGCHSLYTCQKLHLMLIDFYILALWVSAICNYVIVTDPTTSWMCPYTTLWNTWHFVTFTGHWSGFLTSPCM